MPTDDAVSGGSHRIRFVDLIGQHNEIRKELLLSLERVIDGGQFILGGEVEAFENEFARYTRVASAVGTNSGTSALHLALLVAGVGPGDEVITVSLSFWATAAAILYTGASPVLVDVDPTTCNLDPSAFEKAITKKTKAVVPVHLYGRCADMDSINGVARKRRIVVIEDAAQAAGSTYMGRPAGSLGDIACFSFYPAKNLGAIGEGGALVTDNPAFADRARTLRDHGSSKKYSHRLLGYNYRMEAIQAAALRVKLKRLDSWNSARQELATEYRHILTGVSTLAAPDGDGENHHIFPIFSGRRDALRQYLSDRGIDTGVHYPIPIHLQEAYSNLHLAQLSLPHTEQICAQELSLPMHPNLTSREVATVASEIAAFHTIPERR